MSAATKSGEEKTIRNQYEKTAIFIAGNKDIFFPAMVAFNSLERHNPGVFQYFLVFEESHLTPSQKKAIRELAIYFIDSRTLPGYQEMMQLQKMTEDAWPVEVNLNWCVPEYLANLGYKFSIKLDYDVLCVKAMGDITGYFSDRLMFSALKTGADVSIPRHALEILKLDMGFMNPRKVCINSGVVFFNNQLCCSYRLAEKYRKIVQILSAECPEVPTIEQAALALIASNCADQFLVLEKKYHQRAFAPLYYKDGHPDVVIVHFLTEFKPWKEIAAQDFDQLININQHMLVFYRNLWLKFASTIKGFSEFTDQTPANEWETLLVADKVMRVLDSRARHAAKLASKEKAKATIRRPIYTRRLKLSDEICDKLQWVVSYGPFKGLQLSRETWWSRASRAAMLFGIYEQEVLNRMAVSSRGRRRFIDVGAADGYYAVGAVHNGWFEECHAFEIEPKGQQAIGENAALNGVADKVKIHSEASAATLREVLGSKSRDSLMLVDIEGAEFDLMTEEFFDICRHTVVFVELHEFLREDGKNLLLQLRSRAEKTHTIKVFTTGSRDMSNFPELAEYPDTDRWLLCSESRQQLMSWWELSPKETTGRLDFN